MVGSNSEITLRETELVRLNGVLKIGDKLFLEQKNHAQQEFSFLKGDSTISREAIEIFKSNMRHNSQEAIKNGFEYCHIIFSSKALAFRDLFEKFNISLNPIFSSYHKSDNVVYVDFDKADYFDDDTHINPCGMLKVLDVVFSRFGLDLELFPIYREYIGLGDLGKMAGLSPTSKQRVEGFEGFINTTDQIERYSLSNCLKGNTGHIDYHFNPYSPLRKRLILFGDSFFRQHLDIFERVFSEVIYMRNPFIITDVVNVLSPDIVLTGNAERYLVNPPKFDCSKPWFVNYLTTKFDSKRLEKRDIEAFESLFSGKNSKAFKKFMKYRMGTISGLEENVINLTESDLKNDVDVNLARDSAIFFEKRDLITSAYLMRLAHSKRKNSKFIKSKLEEYLLKMPDKKSRDIYDLG